MTDKPEPLPVRPAATVMLVRDTPDGISVFLMRRHSAMEFAAGVMVFPGGGVDDRDRNADIVLVRARTRSGGPSVSASRPTWPRRWCARPRGRRSRSPACCSPGRPTIRTASSPTRRSTTTSAAALVDRSLSFSDFLRGENLVLRADLLRPWANWVTPKEERTRRYDTYFFVGALPQGQRADGENTESDHAAWASPEDAIEDFAEGRVVPAAADVDPAGLADRPHGRRGARGGTPDRGRPAQSCCARAAIGRSSSSTATATTRPATAARRSATARS